LHATKVDQSFPGVAALSMWESLAFQIHAMSRSLSRHAFWMRRASGRDSADVELERHWRDRAASPSDRTFSGHSHDHIVDRPATVTLTAATTIDEENCSVLPDPKLKQPRGTGGAMVVAKQFRWLQTHAIVVVAAAGSTNNTTDDEFGDLCGNRAVGSGLVIVTRQAGGRVPSLGRPILPLSPKQTS
jgi:hypothetical protein